MLRPDPRTPDDTTPSIAEGSKPTEPEVSPKSGLRIPRRFTTEGIHPFDEIEWVQRDAVITNERCEIAF